jgi:hypothetical protein
MKTAGILGVSAKRLFSLLVCFIWLAPAWGQSGGRQHIQKLPRYPASRVTGRGFASPNDLLYYGGPVMSNVQVVVVLWTNGVDATEQNNAGPFFTAVTASPWMDILSEYYTAGRNGQDTLPGSNQIIGHGTYLNSKVITPSLCGSGGSCSLTDAGIQAELIAQLKAGNLPQPQFDAAGNPNTLYMVYFPPGVTITMGSATSCVDFCAYHGTATYNSNPLIYGVAPDFSSPSSGCHPAPGCGASSSYINNFDAVCSHELAESVTDADVGIGNNIARPLAWYNTTLGEIGDICNGMDTTTTVGGNTFSVQTLWSNALGSCVGSESPTPTPSTTVLSSSTVQAKFRQNVTFTATVSSGGVAVVGGTVTFKDGAKTLGSGGVNAQGLSAFSTNQLTIGHHSITASYSGNSVFLSSSSGVLDQYRSPKPH